MREPLYRDVYEALLRSIRSGRLKAGSRLPTLAGLARQHEVSTITAKRALDMLAAKGLVKRWPGRGTFVAPDLIERIGETLSGFAHDILADQDRMDSRTVAVERTRPSTWIARALAPVMSSPEVTVVRNLRSLDGKPILCTDHYLPIEISKDDVEAAGSWVFFRAYLADRFHIIAARSEGRLRAVAAESPVADVLGVPQGTPLLYCEKIFYDISDRACECLVAHALTEQWNYRISFHLGGAGDTASPTQTHDEVIAGRE